VDPDSGHPDVHAGDARQEGITPEPPQAPGLGPELDGPDIDHDFGLGL
jgi:hypothetical protein